jgi:uncharacterized membrane protein
MVVPNRQKASINSVYPRVKTHTHCCNALNINKMFIHVCILTMNLWKYLKPLLLILLRVLYGTYDADHTDTAVWNDNQWQLLSWKPSIV